MLLLVGSRVCSLRRGFLEGLIRRIFLDVKAQVIGFQSFGFGRLNGIVVCRGLLDAGPT